MGVTKAYAEEEVAEFNKWYEAQNKETQSHYHWPSDMSEYRCCKNMELRDFVEGDCPNGVTMSAVIDERLKQQERKE